MINAFNYYTLWGKKIFNLFSLMPKPFFSFSIFNTVIMQHAKLKFKNLHKQFPSSYPPGFSSGSVTVSQTFQSVCLSTYSSSFEMNRTKICLDVQNKKGFTNPRSFVAAWWNWNSISRTVLRCGTLFNYADRGAFCCRIHFLFVALYLGMGIV